VGDGDPVGVELAVGDVVGRGECLMFKIDCWGVPIAPPPLQATTPKEATKQRHVAKRIDLLRITCCPQYPA
jgi:hypothetical protein